jgi:transposase-like protein
MSRERKQIAPPDKLAILKKYLVDKTPISDLCDQHGLQPSQIYHWQALLFEHGAAAFERKPGRQGKQVTAQERRIAHLEDLLAHKDAKLAHKNEVISELMEENVRSKKANGEL